MADMSDAKAHINKRSYTVQNGKGDKDRTTNHSNYSSGYEGIDWSKAKPVKFKTPTNPIVKLK